MVRATLRERASLPPSLQPATSRELEAVCARFKTEGAIPESGKPLEQILPLLMEAFKTSRNTAHPAYLGFVPGGGIAAAALGDTVAGLFNRFSGLRTSPACAMFLSEGYVSVAPALVRLETNVIAWMCNLFGYPSSSSGCPALE